MNSLSGQVSRTAQLISGHNQISAKDNVNLRHEKGHQTSGKHDKMAALVGPLQSPGRGEPCLSNWPHAGRPTGTTTTTTAVTARQASISAGGFVGGTKWQQKRNEMDDDDDDDDGRRSTAKDGRDNNNKMIMSNISESNDDHHDNLIEYNGRPSVAAEAGQSATCCLKPAAACAIDELHDNHSRRRQQQQQPQQRKDHDDDDATKLGAGQQVGGHLDKQQTPSAESDSCNEKPTREDKQDQWKQKSSSFSANVMSSSMLISKQRPVAPARRSLAQQQQVVNLKQHLTRSQPNLAGSSKPAGPTSKKPAGSARIAVPVQQQQHRRSVTSGAKQQKGPTCSPGGPKEALRLRSKSSLDQQSVVRAGERRLSTSQSTSSVASLARPADDRKRARCSQLPKLSPTAQINSKSGLQKHSKSSLDLSALARSRRSSQVAVATASKTSHQSSSFVTQIPTLISQSHASAAAATAATARRPGAPISEHLSNKATDDDEHKSSSTIESRPAKETNLWLDRRASNEAKQVVEVAAARKEDNNDREPSVGICQEEKPDEEKKNKSTNDVVGATKSCVPEASNQQKGDDDCSPVAGREANGEHHHRGRCDQCKLLRVKLELALEERRQLSEQLTELEEMENDSRLMSQRLAKQVLALEQQLEGCRLRLQSTGEAESRLKFQNKRLHFELKQRQECIQQLQYQLNELRSRAKCLLKGSTNNSSSTGDSASKEEDLSQQQAAEGPKAAASSNSDDSDSAIDYESSNSSQRKDDDSLRSTGSGQFGADKPADEAHYAKSSASSDAGVCCGASSTSSATSNGEENDPNRATSGASSDDDDENQSPKLSSSSSSSPAFSTSSCDESDHQATATGATDVNPGQPEEQLDEGQPKEQLTGRQQVHRKRISTARILRGIHVQVQLNQSAAKVACQDDNDDHHHRQPDTNKQDATDSQTTRKKSQLDEAGQSAIELALKGVEELESNKSTTASEVLRLLVDQNGQHEPAAREKVEESIQVSGNKSLDLSKTSGQQQSTSGNTNGHQLIDCLKHEIANLKLRLLQAQTLNDNLVLELNSTNGNKFDGHKGHHNQQQQQLRGSYVHRQQVPGVQNSSQPDAPSRQRSIIYVNGLRASVSHHYHLDGADHHQDQQRNFSAHHQTSIDELGAQLAGREREMVDFLRFLLDKLHLHHARSFELANECQKIAMNSLLASYSHQLNFAHHNGAVMAGNEATWRHQRHLHNQMSAGDQLNGQASVIYPVRPPPRRRNRLVVGMQASEVAQLAPVPSQQQQQQQVANESNPVNELQTSHFVGGAAKSIVSNDEPLNAGQQHQRQAKTSATSSGPSSSALQVAKQTLFSLVPIYYNHAPTKTTTTPSSSVAATANEEAASANMASIASGQKNNESNRSQVAANQAKDVWVPGERQVSFSNDIYATVNKQNKQTGPTVLQIGQQIGRPTGDQQQQQQQQFAGGQQQQRPIHHNHNHNHNQHHHHHQVNSHFVASNNLKNSLSEDIERFRVHFNGQLLDLLTRQNWCESLITDKLKAIEQRRRPINLTQRQQPQTVSRLKSITQINCHQRQQQHQQVGHKNDSNHIEQHRQSVNNLRILQNVTTKSVNVPINCVSLNPNGQQQQQQLGATGWSHQQASGQPQDQQARMIYGRDSLGASNSTDSFC